MSIYSFYLYSIKYILNVFFSCNSHIHMHMYFTWDSCLWLLICTKLCSFLETFKFFTKFYSKKKNIRKKRVERVKHIYVYDVKQLHLFGTDWSISKGRNRKKPNRQRVNVFFEKKSWFQKLKHLHARQCYNPIYIIIYLNT